MIMAVMGVCVMAARKPAMPSAISTAAWSGASRSATSFPRRAPIARLGVNSPPGAPDHAMRGELGDEFGEQADDVEAHRHRAQKSASQSTVTTPASKSTLRL